MEGAGFILGFDIGGTTTAAVLGDRAGRVHNRVERPTEPERGLQRTLESICQSGEQIMARARRQGNKPDRISVSVGGPLDVEQGVIYGPPNLPGWENVPLKETLSDRFSLPCHVEHDGNAGALAEWYFGAARGADNVVFLTMGTGFGAGLILNGKLYRGTCDMAGEVGHLRLAETGPSAYGKAGSWEALCSGTGIARLAALRFPARWSPGEVDARRLAELARDGDAEALGVLAEVGRHLGRGLAMLVDTLNPEVIVIGSLAVRLGDLVLAPAREQMRLEALPRAVQVVRVVPASLGESLGDVAALCAAIAATGGVATDE